MEREGKFSKNGEESKTELVGDYVADRLTMLLSERQGKSYGYWLSRRKTNILLMTGWWWWLYAGALHFDLRVIQFLNFWAVCTT